MVITFIDRYQNVVHVSQGGGGGRGRSSAAWGGGGVNGIGTTFRYSGVFDPEPPPRPQLRCVLRLLLSLRNVYGLP